MAEVIIRVVDGPKPREISITIVNTPPAGAEAEITPAQAVALEFFKDAKAQLSKLVGVALTPFESAAPEAVPTARSAAKQKPEKKENSRCPQDKKDKKDKKDSTKSS